jgi:hypothetical protein
MLYRASDVIGLEVHGKDGPIGWVDEVFCSLDHSVRAVLIDPRMEIASGWKLLVGSSWIDSLDVARGRVDVFLDRRDVRTARPHEGEDVTLDAVALLKP